MNNYEPTRYTHEEIVEMLPAFVVGALDPDEMLAVDHYLQTHPDLAARADRLEAVAANLAYAAPTKPLPKSLLAKVMNRARASLPASSQARPVAQPRPVVRQVSPPQPVPQPSFLQSVGLWWRRRGRIQLALAGMAVAALVLTVVLTQTLVQMDGLRRQVAGLAQQLATAQTENEALRDQNIRLQDQVESQQNQLASLAGATQMVVLGGTEDAPQASGRLYTSGAQATLVLNNLVELDANYTYQLWLIPPDGAPLPAGLLGQAGGPVETITLGLPTTLDGIGAVGISVEPTGGSSAPTGPIVLLGETA